MARIVLVTPAAPGSSTTTPTTEIVEIPETPTTPVLPGVTFNGSPAEFVQFLRDMGQFAPAPVVEPPPALPTTGQRAMRLVEDGYWSFRGMLRGIYNLGLLVVLCLLAAMALGWIPGITLPSSFSFSSPPAISAPAPRTSGPSLSEKLDALSVEIGQVKAEVEGLKAPPQVEAPPAPVVEQALPAAPAPAKQPWRLFPKKAATP